MNWLDVLTFGFIVLLSEALPAGAMEGATPAHATQSTTRLERRLAAINAELEQLAGYNFRGGYGPIGYASDSHALPKTNEWIQIDWKQPAAIDQIVLVPTIGRDAENGFHANAFPAAFKVFTGTAPDTEGALAASFIEADHLLPRIAPLVIPCTATASWIRVEASLLSPRIFDSNYDLKLAEIMVFSGEENVALRAAVRTSSKIRNRYLTQKPRFLTDGFVPYLMDAAEGRQSSYFLSGVLPADPWISIDLGSRQPLNRIHLHAVDQSFSVPLEYMTDFHFPRRLRIEGALKPDFSDARILIELEYESQLDIGPILMHRFPETVCRYVRLIGFEPYINTLFKENQQRIGFAEIELFSHGRNAARGKPVEANFKARSVFGFEALTDGLNFYGEILPVKEWMNQLARRHDLEVERPLIEHELNRRYARQKKNLSRMRWMAILATAGIGVTLLLHRMLRMRMIMQLRERIAANLHDELSANLHAVVLLGEMAQKNIDAHDKLHDILNRIQQLSRRSRSAARHCTDMLQADTACENLTEDMKRSADRLLIDIEHELLIEGEAFLQQLPPRKRQDLFLFYKECLINIARHAGAAQCRTRLTASAREITLTVSDNGSGITQVPRSLKRRAHLLGARVHIDTPELGGASVTLTLRLRPWMKRNRS